MQTTPSTSFHTTGRYRVYRTIPGWPQSRRKKFLEFSRALIILFQSYHNENFGDLAAFQHLGRFLWPLWNRAGHYIFILSFVLSSFFLAQSQPSQTGCLPYFHTWCGLSANLGCRSETCCKRLAENSGRKKSPSGHHLLNSNISSTCPDNMVNFGPLVAEIGLPVWGTPANFNGFRVLAALLHGTLVVGVSQTLGH